MPKILSCPVLIKKKSLLMHELKGDIDAYDGSDA